MNEMVRTAILATAAMGLADLDLDAEKSWNYELGVRGTPRSWLNYEVTGFYMDFLNQVVPANESGGTSTTDTNAGETMHVGVEAAASIELIQAFSRRQRSAYAPKLWIDAGWTWLTTENQTQGGPFNGLELPYAPNHVGHFGIRGELPDRQISAGIYASFYPKKADPAKTVIVGEHVGDRTRFWAESRGPSILPNTRWAIGRSLQKHDLGAGCMTPDCHFGASGRDWLDIAIGSLEPDEPVATTFEQYRSGVDPLMARIRVLIGAMR